MKRIFIYYIITLLAALNAFSQHNFTQTIRGKVIDAQSYEPLPGATVTLIGSEPLIGVSTDAEGDFFLENIPVGRQSLHITFVGYRPAMLQNLLLTSGKEIVLEVKLEENITRLTDVVITAPQNKERPQNDFATVSARSFTVEETERYAGSLGDPSRMVANFAGVMSVNDNRNDIIIRGNSPTGLLWRLEGIDIPSPNHFANEGATGGPISMINNNLLANSDFFTGAFPAQYGNALSGAFDLKLRNGNNHKYEFLGQVGYGGFEIGAEGPFSKKSRASFIVNYRYSTLALMDLLGIKLDFGTGGAVPHYQDLTFKVNIPTERFGRFELFGVGGTSKIAMLEDERDKELSTVMAGTDLYNRSLTGILGLKHTFYFENNGRWTNSLSTTTTKMGTEIDSLYRNDVKETWRAYAFDTRHFHHAFNTEYVQKLGNRNTLQVGGRMALEQFNYLDSVYVKDKYVQQFNSKGNYYLFQGFATWQHKFSNDITLNTGAHFFYFPLNKQWSIEPRTGLQWRLNERHSVSAAFGMHSQTQIPFIYFYRDDDGAEPFRNLGFNKSLHSVLGYDCMIAKDFRLKLEGYFQHIYNIPISQKETPQFSMINVGDDFYIDARGDMANKGLGRNYGIELTLEKFLSRGYYFLITTSLYSSTYRGSDDIWRNTRFNGKYILNALGGYEWTFNQESSLLFDLKGTLSGGKWYTPIDEAATIEDNRLRFIWAEAYSKQAPNYFKLNARITYRLNGKRVTQEWAADLQNVTNHKNVHVENWNMAEKKIETIYQQGFTPMITYRVLF